jgi:hypothetical protein
MLPDDFELCKGVQLWWIGQFSASRSTVEVLDVQGEMLTMRTVGATEAGHAIPRSHWKARASSVREYCELPKEKP